MQPLHSLSLPKYNRWVISRYITDRAHLEQVRDDGYIRWACMRRWYREADFYGVNAVRWDTASEDIPRHPACERNAANSLT